MSTPKVKKVARSVYLPETLNDRLTQEAQRRGFSGNDLVIMALEALLGPSMESSTAPLATPSMPADDVADF